MSVRIDFLFQTNGKIIPIEVKSSNSKATSLIGIKKKYPQLETAYKLTSGNIGTGENGIITIPLYMSMFL